jgi:essential nuclear protein 1
LVDKKFELPYKVVDALVFHFIRLSNSYKAKTRGDSAKLPVLWHQSLLVFAQRYETSGSIILEISIDSSVLRRYASDLTPDQKDALLDVIRATPHPKISAEIRRELVNSVERGAPRTQLNQDVDMS